MQDLEFKQITAEAELEDIRSSHSSVLEENDALRVCRFPGLLTSLTHPSIGGARGTASVVVPAHSASVLGGNASGDC